MQYYTLDTIEEFKALFNIKKIKCKSEKKIKYYNIPCTFDTETSSTYIDKTTGKVITSAEYAMLQDNTFINGEVFDESKYIKFAFMYIWMWNIDGNIIIGRTWEEFESVCYHIYNYFNLKEKRLITYVRNLAFDFNFIKSHFEWEKVFATESHKIIYGITKNNFVFKCSYFLAGCSLEETGKNLQKYKAEKKVGDLDYNLIRTSATPLTDKEIGYCIYDVIVDCNFIRESMEQEKGGSILKLPLTKTGYVRRYCKRYCLSKENRFIYRKIINQFTYDTDLYNQLKRCYAGAFTHAGALNVGKIYKNIYSFDFSSSYPSVLLLEKYPMGKARKVTIASKEQLQKYLKYYCCLFDCTFTNLRPKAGVYENIISVNKCRNIINSEENNGRIVTADSLDTTINEVDFQNINQFYDYDKIQFRNFRIYRKGYLPKALQECIIHFYKGKTTLKGIDDKKAEYAMAKSMLNSIYGFMVTDIVKDVYQLDENQEWEVDYTDTEDALNKLNNSMNRIVAYEWGIWCTSYARRNLYSGVKELGTDFLYADTDSLKFKNIEAHLHYFLKYNEMILRKIKTICEHYNYDINDLIPKTIKGVAKPIGVWDYEGDIIDGKYIPSYKEFKTLGAKRYAYLEGNEYNITLSGVNKKKAAPYMTQLAKEKNINFLDIFSDDLYFPSDKSGKMIHTYIDNKIEYDVADYNGTITHVIEKTSTHLTPAHYRLSILEKYELYFKGLQEKYTKGC